MWVSKREWEDLKKRVADLEKVVRSQQTIDFDSKHILAGFNPLRVSQDSRQYRT